MFKMDVINSDRFRNFSTDGQDVVTAGVELYKHFKALEGSKEYAEYASTGKTYDEKSKLFTESLLDEAIKMSGMNLTEAGKATAFAMTGVRESAFQLVSEMLDAIVPNTILQDFYRLAEVKNMAWGDNMNFQITSPDLFAVSKTAGGVRRGQPQRQYAGDAILTPTWKEITIQEDMIRILAGKVNWGTWVAKVAQSFETAISTDVYTALLATFSTLPSTRKVAGYTQTDFVKFAQRIEALNRGSKCVVLGTKLALSTIIPSDNYLKFGLGEEYNKMGYLGNFMGVDLMVIDQKIVPSTENFAISDDYIYFVSLGIDKPVKIGFEGTTMIQTSEFKDNADLTQNYSIFKKYDVKVITSGKYAIMKLTA